MDRDGGIRAAQLRSGRRRALSTTRGAATFVRDSAAFAPLRGPQRRRPILPRLHLITLPIRSEMNGRRLRKKTTRKGKIMAKIGCLAEMKAKGEEGPVWRKKKPKSTQLSKSDPSGNPFESFSPPYHPTNSQLQLDQFQLTFEAFPLRHSFRRAGPDHLLSPPPTTPHTNARLHSQSRLTTSSPSSSIRALLSTIPR